MLAESDDIGCSPVKAGVLTAMIDNDKWMKPWDLRRNMVSKYEVNDATMIPAGSEHEDLLAENGRLRAALQAIINRAEFRMGSTVSDDVVKIAREALKVS